VLKGCSVCGYVEESAVGGVFCCVKTLNCVRDIFLIFVVNCAFFVVFVRCSAKFNFDCQRIQTNAATYIDKCRKYVCMFI